MDRLVFFHKRIRAWWTHAHSKTAPSGANPELRLCPQNECTPCSHALSCGPSCELVRPTRPVPHSPSLFSGQLSEVDSPCLSSPPPAQTNTKGGWDRQGHPACLPSSSWTQRSVERDAPPLLRLGLLNAYLTPASTARAKLQAGDRRLQPRWLPDDHQLTAPLLFLHLAVPP